MPDDARAARPRPATKPQPESLVPNYAAFLTGQDAFARWVQGMVTLSQEIARFTQSRVQEDFTAWWALAFCRSPEDAVTLQQRFAAKAIEEYSEEIAKLSQTMMTVATEGLASVQRRPAAEV